jgi:hypothetical protein
MTGEKTALYLGGAFMVAIMVWASIAFMRAEEMLDWRLAGALVVVTTIELVRRRQRKRG